MFKSTILQRLKNESYYWTIGFYSLCVAGVTHSFFLLLFSYLKITPLIVANILSVAIYYYLAFILGIKSLEAKDDSLIGWIVYFELTCHAVLAVVCLGVSSGFQYYLYVLAFLPFFNATYNQATRSLRFVLIVVISLGVEIFGYNFPPLYPLDDTVIFSFQLMNLVFFLVILGVISFFYFQESEKYQEILLDDSCKDPLTKLFNRRFIIQKMENVFPGLTKNGLLGAVILLDIDFFKKINDTYGHNAGDDVLVSLGKVLQQNMRSDSIVSRWGGEEFLISCYVTDKINLMKIMERLRVAASAMTILYDEQEIAITITLGAAISTPGESFADAISRADQALYAGKEAGRNQSMIAK